MAGTDLFSLVATLELDTSSYENSLSGLLSGASGDITSKLGPGLSSITKLVGGVDKALGIAGKAAYNFLGDVVKTGMGFDKQMSAVQAVLGAEEGTVENMNRLRAQGLEVAENSIFTAEEVGQAYYYMGMAGWKTEQQLTGLQGVINLAAASGEDLGLVSDMVTDSLTAFGLGAGQATHYADVLAQAATNSNTDVARMGKTFQYVGAVAGSLAYSVEDVAVTTGLLASAGIKGTMAGTTMRNIFSRLAINAGATSKSPGARDLIENQLNTQFFDENGHARPWMDVLKDMRKSWKELDPETMNEVASSMGEFTGTSEEAQAIVTELAGSLDSLTTEWNGLTDSTERENFAQNLEPTLNALGISMRDENGQLREFNQVAAETRGVLGGLTDEQKQFMGYKIGTMRGTAGFIRLMEASDEEVEKLEGSINDAEGAAERMANVKLDNLWGDTVKLGAAFDVLKIAVFDDIKGPMRDIVQFLTTSVQNITDAIQRGGLIAGIEQAGVEIESLADKIGPILEAVGTAIGPVILKAIDVVVTDGEATLVKLGGALAQGLLQGIQDTLGAQLFSGGGFLKSPITEALGALASGKLTGWVGALRLLNGGKSFFNMPTTKPAIESVVTKPSQKQRGLTGKEGEPVYHGTPVMPENPYKTDVGLGRVKANGPDVNGAPSNLFDWVGDFANAVTGIFKGKSIASSITDSYRDRANDRREAREKEEQIISETTIQLDTSQLPTKAAGPYVPLDMSELPTESGGPYIPLDMSELPTKSNGPYIPLDMSELPSEAKGPYIPFDMSGLGEQTDPFAASVVIDPVSEAQFQSDWGSFVQGPWDTSVTLDSTSVPTITNALNAAANGPFSTSVTVSAASLAGLVSTIQGYLNNRPVTIKTVGGGGTFKPEKQAAAMNRGRIFNKATVFGFADGKYQVAGDAGPEAVVGTHSLSRMIQDSVAGAMSGLINKLGELGNGPQNLQVVLDTGTLVGAIAPSMNRELGSISDWRRGNRA